MGHAGVSHPGGLQADGMTARPRAILTAIVESYVETGERVGSGTIGKLTE